MSDSPSLNVLIAGGGAAALEAAFRLQRVGERRVRTTLLAPGDHLATHALAVLVPFAAGAVPRVSLAGLASDAGARLRHGRLASVDAAAHQAITAAGDALGYDALLVAVGAVPHVHPHALTFGAPGTEERMHGLIQDVEAGFVRRIAFVVPEGNTWPVPLYELTLLTADRAYDMCLTPELTVVTPEPAPLALFGAEASQALATRLAGAGVTVVTGTRTEIPTSRAVELRPGGERLTVDHVVTLATLSGPAIPGLPHDPDGYLPVDDYGRVPGASDVYAAGDVTHHRIKQGGLACQQADAAAGAIAAQAGAAIEPQPYMPTLQGVLVTERGSTLLRRGTGEDPDRWPPTKLAGRELSRLLSA
jgi:sulfide:quinone oxidoreductase